MKYLVISITLLLSNLLLAQSNCNKDLQPILDSLLSEIAGVSGYTLKGDPQIILFESTANASNVVVTQEYKLDNKTKHLITVWSKKGIDLDYSGFYRININKYNFEFVKDNTYPLLIMKSKVMDGNNKKEDIEIIVLLNSTPQQIFKGQNFTRKYQDHELKQFEEGTLIKSQIFFDFKDLNSDGANDLKAKIVEQNYKPKECSCENGMLTRIINREYHFINGSFILSNEEIK